MAVRYHPIFSKIWNDPDFIKLDSDSKYLFFAIRTAPECNAACLFHLYLEIIQLRTGLDMKRIKKAMNTLSSYHWVYYEDGIIWIRNGLKYNNGINMENQNHVKSILNIIDDMPKSKIVENFCKYYSYSYNKDTTTIPSALYPYPDSDSDSDTISDSDSDTISDSENDSDSETEKKRKKENAISMAEIDSAFEIFWDNYPRKEGKSGAKKHFIDLVKKNKHTSEDMLMPSKKDNYLEIFDTARKSFLGKKRSAETEFENFKKKHNDWKEVIRLLLPAIEKQNDIRRIKIENNQWVAEVKIFQTWINQRCWEEEEEIDIKKTSKTKDFTEEETMKLINRENNNESV